MDFDDLFKRWSYFPRTKIKYSTLRRLRSLKSKDVGHKNWRDWLEYLARNVHLEPTLHERVQEGTFHTLLPIWMQNFAENLPYIRYGDALKMEKPENPHMQTFAELVVRDPVLEMEVDYEDVEGEVGEHNGIHVKNPPEGSAVVVGRGPSMFQHEHCKMLYDHRYQGLVVASDGGLIPLLKAGVVPDVVVTVDGAPVIKKYFDHPLVRKHGDKMKLIVTVTVNHEVYKTARDAGMDIYWFNPIFDDWRKHESWTRLQVLMTRTDENHKGIPRASAGGNSGAFAWITAMSIFKRSPVALIGIDFGYPADTPLEDTQYYSTVLEMADGDVEIIKKAYNEFHHPYWDTDAYVDTIFYHYRQAFLEMQLQTSAWFQLYGGTVNCTEGGTLFGEGITCMDFKDFLEKYER